MHCWFSHLPIPNVKFTFLNWKHLAIDPYLANRLRSMRRARTNPFHSSPNCTIHCFDTDRGTRWALMCRALHRGYFLTTTARTYVEIDRFMIETMESFRYAIKNVPCCEFKTKIIGFAIAWKSFARIRIVFLGRFRLHFLLFWHCGWN